MPGSSPGMTLKLLPATLLRPAAFRHIFHSMPHASRRSTARLRLVSDKAAAGERSRRPHPNATVAKVRRLIEKTPLSYEEIALRTGVGRASICRWTRDGGWQRHLFAPRATDTVPRERAGARLRLRTLAGRLAALAERYTRELEETPGVDVDKLAARPRKPRRSPGMALRSADATAAMRMFAEMRALGVNPARAPEQAVIDYIESRSYEDPAARPRNRTKRARHEAWLREKESDR